MIDAKVLEAHFDTAFDAPNGIKKLRELILTLAMQGKLVPQDPKDEPAIELLKKIEAEKKRLVKEGKIKASRGDAEKAEVKGPYELPKGWVWTRLGEIGIWKSGSTPSRSNSQYYGGSIPWVKSGEVKQGRIKSTEESITQKALNECSLSLNEKGCVLVAMYGANIGEVGILDIEATTNQAVCACKTYTDFYEQYLLLLITSLKPYFISQGAGAAQPNISREKIIATVFPLPPLAEQKRIVAKIDQLMARCDELEKMREGRHAKRLAAHAASIKDLLAPSGNFGFISSHFSEFYSVRENVAELRKAILQLAVMGKLVPQDPKDQPASELLKEIQKEKARLVKEGKIKDKGTQNAEVKEPYELPKGWVWTRLGEVATKIGSGSTPNGGKESYLDNGTPLIRSMNVHFNGFKKDGLAYIDERQAEKLKNVEVQQMDILLNITGASIGRVCIAPMEMNGARVNQHVCIIRILEQLNIPFLNSYLASPIFQNFVDTNQVGATREALTKSMIEEHSLPLPPLAEQKRIVARIDQLMSLCDELEKQIDATTQKQGELLQSLVAAV